MINNGKFQIVSWQSVLTEHQVHLWIAIQKLGVDVRIVSAREILDERLKQGWTVPADSGLSIHILTSRNWLREGIEEISVAPNALHIFGGLWADQKLFIFLLLALMKGTRVGLMSEPYSDVATGYLKDQSSLKGRLLQYTRPFVYRFAGILLGKKIAPILAISPKAVRQFAAAGFAKDNIYPFGYFVPKINDAETVSRMGSKYLKVIYLGSLIRRKGLDVLLNALSVCRSKGVNLSVDVYGHGDISKYPIDAGSGVTFKGSIPFGTVQSSLKKYDLLVVPSRFDGWGVVVNEAVLQGVPVIASSEVGAGAMISKWCAGAIFESESFEELSELLEKLSRNMDLLDSWRQRSLLLSSQITPESAADYLCACINSCLFKKPRPQCVWY